MSVFSERCRVRNKLKQSIIVSERTILTTPSDVGSVWSAQGEQQAE